MPSQRLLCLCVFLLPALSAGCGLNAYEERLARTDERNAYYAHLDEVLQPVYWNHPQFDLWLRPPAGLASMPEPQPPKAAEGEEPPDPPPDPRLEYRGVPLDLPGLIHAWEGNLPVAGGGSAPYRLYLLGNHSRFISSSDRGDSKPQDYINDLEIVLQNLFQQTLPPGDRGRSDEPNVKFRAQIPSSERFVVPKPFAGVNFVPLEGTFPEGQEFRGWLYEYTNGPVQTALLMLTPSSPSLDVRDAFQTSLETLRVSPQPPRVQAGRRGAAPSGGGARPTF